MNDTLPDDVTKALYTHEDAVRWFTVRPTPTSEALVEEGMRRAASENASRASLVSAILDYARKERDRGIKSLRSVLDSYDESGQRYIGSDAIRAARAAIAPAGERCVAESPDPVAEVIRKSPAAPSRSEETGEGRLMEEHAAYLRECWRHPEGAPQTTPAHEYGSGCTTGQCGVCGTWHCMSHIVGNNLSRLADCPGPSRTPAPKPLALPRQGAFGERLRSPAPSSPQTTPAPATTAPSRSERTGDAPCGCGHSASMHYARWDGAPGRGGCPRCRCVAFHPAPSAPQTVPLDFTCWVCKTPHAEDAPCPSAPQTTPDREAERCRKCGRTVASERIQRTPCEKGGRCEPPWPAPQTTPAPEGTCAECGNVLPRAVKCVSCGAYNSAPRLSTEGAAAPGKEDDRGE